MKEASHSEFGSTEQIRDYKGNFQPRFLLLIIETENQKMNTGMSNSLDSVGVFTAESLSPTLINNSAKINDDFKIQNRRE
mmetsp:Transcript_2613/g.4756  ORF Transcript_2613/g.4756 Transcript_2613/m.4756 type:complete len:80 (-) Transcript_2613:245-484(-)